MADKAISELIGANQVTPTDLFVLEQNGTAKKLTGQVLENWLVSFADGHGGIQSIVKVGTSGLADTYRITLADTTTFDFVVTNGRSVNGISKTSTSGLVDTYTITYNNGTTSTFTVTNGDKGDKGDNAYVWIKYASQEPTEASHSIGDIPDDWIGIYSGNASSAPSDWTLYKWFQYKGDKGDTGVPATLVRKSVSYQVGDSGSIIPSGSWGSSVPVVPQGKYLWTKTEVRFNTGDPIVSYSVARMGMDGTGSVSSVAGVSPDETGNVTLTAADVGALAVSGGDITGGIRMNGQPISGLNDPTEDTQAARKGYVDASVRKAAPRNLLDNSDFRNPVMQAGFNGLHGTEPYIIDRWKKLYGVGTVTQANNGILISGGDTECYVQQKIDTTKLVGKTLTMAAHFSNGFTLCGSAVLQDMSTTTVFASENGVYLMTVSGGFAIRVTAGYEHTVEWTALYEGEYTIDTLPEYHPKGYGAELAECLRYFERLGGSNSDTLGNSVLCVGGFSSFINSAQYYPKRMPRPTVKLYDASNYRLLLKKQDTALTYSAASVKSIDNITIQSPFVQFRVNLEQPENQNAWVSLQRTDNAQAAYIDICADL